MVQERIEELKKLKENKDAGFVNCIPFSDAYPVLSEYHPGIIKGLQYMVTASSGIGKTQLMKHMFILTPYRFVKKNPHLKIKLKIFVFALEESRNEFIDSIICSELYNQFNIEIDTLELQSLYDRSPSNEIFQKIDSIKGELEDLFKYVEVIDSVHNPTGLYKYLRNYSEENGKHIWVDKQFKKVKASGETEITTEKVYSHYEANDPNEFVIAITDNLNILAEEKDKLTGLMLTKHQTISKWSLDYCRKQITKHWNYTVVNVQQQAAESEKQQFTNTGASVEKKVEPSLDGLADNKLTQRDAFVIFGLFAPTRYEFPKHLGYDITKLKDNYRCLIILKNRVGKTNLRKGMYFNGKNFTFKELPLPTINNLPNPALNEYYK
jgi:hypothetical protein